MKPIRLTVLLTHPVQYYAPWFQHIADHAPALQLTVLYGTSPTPLQQGAGFGRPVQWDVPLRSGYESIVVRGPTEDDSVRSDDFWGVDSNEVGAALIGTRPDVVLIPGWHSALYIRVLAACRQHDIPVLYRGDTNLGTRPRGIRRMFWRTRSRILLRSFHGYLSVGRRAKEFLLTCGATPWRIFDAPHAIDNEFFATRAAPFQSGAARAEVRDRFGLPRDAFVLIFVGKCKTAKRPLDLIRAAATLGAGVAVLLVGDGPLAEECSREAARLGVSLVRTGFLNQTELPTAYAAANCLVLPSDSNETWGLVVNEALATGLPSVVSDHVGCALDLVDESTGEVYRAGDVAGLAAAIDRVRSKVTAGHDYVAACRQRADQYSFAAATSGVVRACASIRDGETPKPRLLAWCGHMVAPGGMERITFEGLHAIRRGGGFVHCILNDWENQRILTMAEAAGATSSTVRTRQPLRRRMGTIRAFNRTVWEMLLASADLLRWRRRLKATHVFLPDYAAVIRTCAALAWLRLRGVPIVLRLGNAPEAGRFYRLIWRWLVRPLVDGFICNSRFTASVAIDYGIPADKVRIIRNTVPSRPRRSRVAPERADIIYVGQIIPEKGVDVLLDAIALAVADMPWVTANIVGRLDGWVSPRYVGYIEALQRRAEAPDLKNRVQFLGWREDVLELMAAARLHCCPSLPEQREGFGIVVVEAKSAGIPSVVFATGALPELVEHRVDGWVCHEFTAPALAGGLRHFLSDPERLEAAGIAARRSLPSNDTARFAAEWCAVFGASDPLIHGSSGQRSRRDSNCGISR